MQKQIQVLFYELGRGHATQANGTPLYSWPYETSYAPDYRPQEFFLADGDGRNGNGGFFPAATVLEPQWRAHLEITQTLWLLPILERMARGETVAPEEILRAHKRENGKTPRKNERTLYGYRDS